MKVVIDNLKATDGKDIVKYDQIINFGKDNVAPTILGTEKLSATTVKVKFSEPIKALNTAGTSVTFKDADGNVIAGSGNGVTSSALANNDTEVTFTLGSDVPANKVITATFVGVQDKAGNVQTPNPATVTFQKGEQDAVGAKVSAITQTGAKTFTIKFDKPVQKPAAADITVGGTDTTGTVKAIGTDSTTFEFTAATALDGASTVATGSGKVITDLSGKTSTFSQVVNFVKDEVAPKVTSTQVVKDATDGKEYLEIIFDKNVNLDGTTDDSTVTGNGTYTKDYVTSASTAFGPTTVTYKDVANKKVVRVELDTFLGTTTDVEGAKYNLDLTFTKLTGDTNVVAAKAENVTFTRGKDGTAVTNDVAKVTAIDKVSGDNNKVTVTFDKAVEGASATNPANYKVDGAVVESVTLAAAASGTQVATLNLKKDSNSFSGTRNVTVENVKTLSSGKVIERTVLPVVLDENVRPTVTKAQLTATDKITITFSEIVSNADDTAGADFDLYVGNTKSAKTVAAEVVTVNSEKNTLVLTISADLTAAEIAQGISLKPTANLNIKDAKANPLNIPASITVTQ